MLSLRGLAALWLGVPLLFAATVSRADPDPAAPWAGGLNEKVLRLATEAVECAERMGQPQAQRLAVIDYSLPSSERRLWVFDLSSGQLLMNDYVAHGRGSGDRQALRFSNVSQSYTSSLGLFRTAETYEGANGYSLRLQGLESGINDSAYERQIVIHGADYVSQKFIRNTGRIGRSYGCPAVRREVAKPLIDYLRGGQYLYAYAEDASWAGTPVSLGCQQAAPSTLQAAHASTTAMAEHGLSD